MPHACWLASVYTPVDTTAAGLHVWEHNNLAQKNLSVVNLIPGDSMLIPFQLGNLFHRLPQFGRLELRREGKGAELAVSLVHREPSVLRALVAAAKEIQLPAPKTAAHEVGPTVRFLTAGLVELGHGPGGALRLHVSPESRIEFGAPAARMLAVEPHDSEQPAEWVSDAAGSAALAFPPGPLAGIPVGLKAGAALKLALKITAPRNAQPGSSMRIHLVQRNADRQVVGGITVQVNIVGKPS